MPKSPFTDTRSLEDAFFEKENAQLLRDMRKKVALAERREALRQSLKDADEALLDHLVALGIGAETILAMTLLPLVRVAWADGAIDAKERAAILRGAEARGVQPGTPARQLLETWLDRRPSEPMIEAWRKYVQGVWPSLTAHERDELRDMLLGLARGVAEAAGGFLGLGSKVSPAERAVLEETEAALR